MDKDILRKKFMGSMIGTAIGDSVGAGFEGLTGFTAAQVREVTLRRRVLRYTDDTHMMIGVAESLISCEGFDAEHMAKRFIHNYNWEPFRGYGPGPPRVFDLIQSGESWETASEKLYPGGSYGNGAAMRIAPIALYYYDDPQKMREVTFCASHITHAHILGKEGAVLEAAAIALATGSLSGPTLDRQAFLKHLGGIIEQDLYRQKICKMHELSGENDPREVAAELGTGIEAFNSVPAAIFSFLMHPFSFEEAVIYAVSLGGDTDTIGAMTGAISGAYLGIDAIPDEWLRKLENRLYIEPLSEELWRIKTRTG